MTDSCVEKHEVVHFLLVVSCEDENETSEDSEDSNDLHSSVQLDPGGVTNVLLETCK